MKFNQKLLWGGAALLLLTGCIDDKYDLSDIDTTSEFKVNDLVLPVNLEPVYLRDIIKVKEGEKLKEVTIGDKTFFAVQESGTFESDPIDITGFTSNANQMNPTNARFTLSGAQGKRTRAGEDQKVYLLMDEVYQDLDYNADNIDGSLRALDIIYYSDVHFTINMKLVDYSTALATNLENITLKMPQGLTIKNVEASGYTYSPADYDPESGLLQLSRVDVTEGESSINVITTAISLKNYPDAFQYDPVSESGSFALVSEFSIEKGGNLVIAGDAQELLNLPEELNFTVTYDVSPLVAESIIGNIEYDLEGTGLAIDPINLEDLPDFLDDPKTNLVLANPQIYLGMNNPVAEYGLIYQSSLDILAIRNNVTDARFPSPLIVVGTATTDHNFLLAPHEDEVTAIPEEYADNLKRLRYDGLGEILAGNGLPDKLDIDLVNPIIPNNKVTRPFKLNTDISSMTGTYDFIAPLALKEGSEIVKTVDGWYSEDLEDLTIQKLSITAMATSDVPSEVLLHVYPIDVDGKRILDTPATAKLEAFASNVPLDFTLTGEIKGTDKLDGVEIDVFSATDNDDDSLAPQQSITLDNLKAKVSGFYLKKF